jgi:hypothetical protein
VAVVVPRYRPGAPASTARLEPVEALARLAPEVLNLGAAGLDGLATLAHLVTGVPCAALDHGGGREALDALGRAVAQAATPGGLLPTPEHETP